MAGLDVVSNAIQAIADCTSLAFLVDQKPTLETFLTLSLGITRLAMILFAFLTACASPDRIADDALCAYIVCAELAMLLAARGADASGCEIEGWHALSTNFVVVAVGAVEQPA